MGAGDRLIEAQHINRSLSALGDVMAALASKDKHIPFRNSKLTQLLADSLSGQAKVCRRKLMALACGRCQLSMHIKVDGLRLPAWGGTCSLMQMLAGSQCSGI